MPPLENLPSELLLPDRNDTRDRYLRNVRIRNPEAETVEGTLEFADASVFADVVAPIYFDAKNIGDFVACVNKRGAAVDTELREAGTSRLPAAGGSGAVYAVASTGGGTIFAGDDLKDPISRQRFQCTATALYQDGQQVPILGFDVGPNTNLPPGRILQWTSPRPGIGQNSPIVLQADGTGLSGGRLEETDAQAIDRLRALRAKPAAAGNDADYQKAISEATGLSVQQPFTYPAINGAGTIGCTFTIRPNTPGANRVPSTTQLADMGSYLAGKFPADDGIVMLTLVPVLVQPIFGVTWAPGAQAWADPSPWPPYSSTDPVLVDATVTPTPLVFRLTTGTTTTTPKVGQTICFYDHPNFTFRKKRILTVTVIVAGKSWDIVVDESNGTSDLTYAPVATQMPGPWSESLDVLVAPVTNFFDNVGPGESVDPIPDPALRQRRSPRSPTVWGNSITNRILTPLFALTTVGDVELNSPNAPYPTPVGVAGITANLLTLDSIVAFPQS